MIIVGLALVIQSYWDLKLKAIPYRITLVLLMVGVICSWLSHRNIVEVMLALIPGIVCLLLSKFTREAIGYGDGLLLCALAMFFPCDRILELCTIACILAGVVALALLALRKKKGKDELPFVPFLLMAYIFHVTSDIGVL